MEKKARKPEKKLRIIIIDEATGEELVNEKTDLIMAAVSIKRREGDGIMISNIARNPGRLKIGLAAYRLHELVDDVTNDPRVALAALLGATATKREE